MLKSAKITFLTGTFLILSLVLASLLTTWMTLLGLYNDRGGLPTIIGGMLAVSALFYLLSFLFSTRTSQPQRISLAIFLATLLVGMSHADKIEAAQNKRDFPRAMAEMRQKIQAAWATVSVSAAGCDDLFFANDRKVYQSCVRGLLEISRKQNELVQVLESIESAYLPTQKDNDETFRELWSFVQGGRRAILEALKSYTQSATNIFAFLEKNHGSFRIQNEKFYFSTHRLAEELNDLMEKFERSEDNYNYQLKAYSETFNQLLERTLIQLK